MDRLAAMFEIEKKGDAYPFEVLNKDLDSGLVLLHYDPETVGQTDVDDKVRRLRGVIVDISDAENYKVVCPTTGYVATSVTTPEEFRNKDHTFVDTDGKSHTVDREACQVFPVYEGVMLRIWKHKGSLMISSYKRIDCTRSKWGGGLTFREMLDQYLDVEKIEVKDGHTHCVVVSDPHLMSLSSAPGAVQFICTFKEPTGTPDYTSNQEAPWARKPDPLEHVWSVCRYAKDSDVILVQPGKKTLRVVTPQRRFKMEMVGNDPNILHRCYELADLALFKKKGQKDDFLEKFPPIPVIFDRDVQTKNIRTKEDLLLKGVRLSNNQLTNRSDPKVHERRLRVVLSHYAMAISDHYFLEVLDCISTLMKERQRMVKVLQANFDKFKTGDFSGYTNKDMGSIGRYLKGRLMNAEKFARENCKGGPEEVRRLTMHNVETGVLGDTGNNLYRMAALLVRD